jgi:hypothetical protein
VIEAQERGALHEAQEIVQLQACIAGTVHEALAVHGERTVQASVHGREARVK